MSFRKYFRFAAIAAALFAFAQLAYGQTAGDGKIASMSVGAGSVRWDILVPNSGGALTVMFPDGRSVRKGFRAGGSPEFDLSDKQLESLPEGVYNYDLKLAPVITAAQKETLMKARGSDDDPEAERNLRKRPAVPTLSQTGSFALVNGSLVGPGGFEGQRTASNSAPSSLKTETAAASRTSSNTAERLRNHRFSLLRTPDIVNADDVIIQGSLCVGLDCVNNESFGFDTIRLKENNTRIKFDDTSTSAGFPNNDWQLTANDSASGGANKFSIEDITGSKVPFTITAGAPTNSMFVASSGKVGFGNSSPVLNLHVTATDTPAIRQEQTSGGGFTAQTWDIGANEANWFVRDVTGGSRLPLRIRPGAPTSSIDVSAQGLVGVGTASPVVNLDVRGSNSKIQIGTDTTSFLNGLQTGLGISNGTEKFLSVVQTGGGFFGTVSNHPLGLIANNNTRVTISGAGAVQFNNYGAGTLTTDASGNITASSDERLKKNIRPFTRGLQNVLGLKPILYGYTPASGLDQTRNDYAGFSAQNVKEFVPEAVGKDSRGMLTLSDRPIIVALVNSIKEQQKEIEELKRQVKQLRATSRRSRR